MCSSYRLCFLLDVSELVELVLEVGRQLLVVIAILFLLLLVLAL